jgi:hypothetical protein
MRVCHATVLGMYVQGGGQSVVLLEPYALCVVHAVREGKGGRALSTRARLGQRYCAVARVRSVSRNRIKQRLLL